MKVPKPLKKLNPSAQELEDWRREVNLFLAGFQEDMVEGTKPEVLSPVPSQPKTQAVKIKPRRGKK